MDIPVGKNHMLVLRDPVHQLIVIDSPVVERLLGSPALQRLRHVSQLGVNSLVFPGATHNRFSHSLGTYWVAKRIIRSLQDAGQFDVKEVGKEWLEALEVAALLHDVGHGPFSHVWEHVSEKALGQKVTHEDMTVSIIQERFMDILGKDLKQRVIAILQGSLQGKKQFLRDIVKSQLDADRMDYLLRDAHYTGVRYGTYDLEWLLHSLRLVEYRGKTRLAVDFKKGLRAVEQFLLARFFMYHQVYFHRAVRAWEAALICLFKYLANFSPEERRRLLNNQVATAFNNPKDYHLLKEWHMWNAIENLSRNDDRRYENPIQLSRMILDRQKPPFSALYIGDEGPGRFDSICNSLHQRKDLHFDIHLDDCSTSIYKGILYYARKRHQKPEEEEAEEEEDIILVVERDEPKPIELVSPSILEHLQHKHRLPRLFWMPWVDEEIRKELERLGHQGCIEKASWLKEGADDKYSNGRAAGSRGD